MGALPCIFNEGQTGVHRAVHKPCERTVDKIARFVEICGLRSLKFAGPRASESSEA